MCKQHDIYFECGHMIEGRLSTCNFKVTGLSRDGVRRWKACMSYSYIARAIPGLCSDCYLLSCQAKVEFEAEALRLRMIGEADTVQENDAETWAAEELNRISTSLPKRQAERQSNTSVRDITWQTRKRSGRKSSLLSTEFKAEEVIGHEEWETRVVGDDDVVSTESTDSAWPVFWDDSEPSECSSPQLTDNSEDTESYGDLEDDGDDDEGDYHRRYLLGSEEVTADLDCANSNEETCWTHD